MENLSKREQILLVSYEILGKSGLENLHARTVAAELKMNHAAVHYYFKTREDLLVALVGYAQKRFESDLDRVTSALTSASKRLEAHIALYEAYARPQSRYFRVLSSLFVAGATMERVREATKGLLSYQQQRLAAHLDEAAASVKPGHPLAHGRSLHEYLFGLCFWSQMSGHPDPTGQIDRLLGSLIVQ